MSLSSLVPNEGYSLWPSFPSFNAEITAYCGKSKFYVLSSPASDIAALEQQRT